jgi:hypothetical protein
MREAVGRHGGDSLDHFGNASRSVDNDFSERGQCCPSLTLDGMIVDAT